MSRWTFASSAVARRALRLAVVALAASWLGFYFMTPWPATALDAFRATALLHFATAMVLVPYLVWMAVNRKLPAADLLHAPVIAALGAYFLATATSQNWRVSLESSLFLLMAASVFFVLSDARIFRRWQVEAAIALAALATAVRALWVVGVDYADWLRISNAVEGGLSWGALVPPTVPRVHDVGDHVNMLGMVLAMALPFLLVAALRRGMPALRVFGVVAAAVVATALFFTLSRAAWLGAWAGCLVTIGAVALAFAGVRDALSSGLARLYRRRWLSLAGAGAATLAALAVVWALVWSLDSRPEWLFRESGSARWDVLTAGAEMVKDYPLVGTGPDVFGLLYPEYSGENPRFHYHTHNGFLQTAVDAGVPGVLAMALLGGAFLWFPLRAIPRAAFDAKLTLIATVGALTVFATHSLFEAPNESKSVLVAVAAVGALAVLACREAGLRNAPAPAGRLGAMAGRLLDLGGRAAIPIAMIALLLVWGWLDLGHYQYSSALANANRQHWPQAVERARRAVELDPPFAIYRLELGTILGQAYLATGDEEQLDDAIAALERAIELEPRSSVAHANLALLLSHEKEQDAAREEALAALRFDNGDPAVALAAGTTLEEGRWDEEAVEAYARVLSLDPSLAESPFWNNSPFRRAHYEEIVGRSTLARRPCVLLELASSATLTVPVTREEALARCTNWVAARPDDAGSRIALAEALTEDGDWAAAKLHLDRVLAQRPDSGPARTALGKWHAAQGRLAEARSQWLRAGQLRQVEALVLLGESYLPGEVPPAVVDKLSSLRFEAASEVQVHMTGILYYRRSFYRESPVTILLPGPWQQAVPADFARAEESLVRWAGASP